MPTARGGRKLLESVVELFAGEWADSSPLEAAAWVDALPAGQTILAAATMECMCGAPFDLEATPVFRQRLEEAGFDWPPPTVIRNPPQP